MVQRFCADGWDGKLLPCLSSHALTGLAATVDIDLFLASARSLLRLTVQRKGFPRFLDGRSGVKVLKQVLGDWKCMK